MPYGQTFRALGVTDGAVVIDIAVRRALSALMRTVACEIRRSIAVCEKNHFSYASRRSEKAVDA